MKSKEFSYMIVNFDKMNKDIKCLACEAGIPRKVWNGTNNIRQREEDRGESPGRSINEPQVHP